MRLERGWLGLRRIGRDQRLGRRFRGHCGFAWEWPWRDNRADHMVLGFPAVLLLASDHKDLLAGAKLAKPGDIRGGDVALAVGRGPQQAQVVDPPVLRPARAARSLAKKHDVLGRRIHGEQQADAASLVVDNHQDGLMIFLLPAGRAARRAARHGLAARAAKPSSHGSELTATARPVNRKFGGLQSVRKRYVAGRHISAVRG